MYDNWNGNTLNAYAELKNQGTNNDFFSCEKNSSANGNRERRIFFVNRSSNQKP